MIFRLLHGGLGAAAAASPCQDRHVDVEEHRGRTDARRAVAGLRRRCRLRGIRSFHCGKSSGRRGAPALHRPRPKRAGRRACSGSRPASSGSTDDRIRVAGRTVPKWLVGFTNGNSARMTDCGVGQPIVAMMGHHAANDGFQFDGHVRAMPAQVGSGLREAAGHLLRDVALGREGGLARSKPK